MIAGQKSAIFYKCEGTGDAIGQGPPPPLGFELSGSPPETGGKRFHQLDASGRKNTFDGGGVRFSATAVNVVIDLAGIEGMDETTVPGIFENLRHDLGAGLALQ